MRTTRGPLGPSAGLVILAAAVLPFVVEAAKPLYRRLGDGLVKLGEAIKESMSEPEPSSQPPTSAATAHATAEPPRADPPVPEPPVAEPTDQTDGTPTASQTAPPQESKPRPRRFRLDDGDVS